MTDALRRYYRVDSPRTPGLMAERLRTLCDNALILLSDPNQNITIEVAVLNTCPDALVDVMQQVAREFVGNALIHGMHVRAAGRISVQVMATIEHTRLVVSDDGWGPHGDVKEGNGIGLARKLAASYGGNVWLRRTETTDATLLLRHPKPR